MKRSSFRTNGCGPALLCAPLLLLIAALEQAVGASAQSSASVISLATDETSNERIDQSQKDDASRPSSRVNFRSFPAARAGDTTRPERLVLRFSGPAKLTRIEVSGDFAVGLESTCAEGRSYSDGDNCTLLVRFAPRGPGWRLGKLGVADTASARSLTIGLGGNGFAPVVSFTPAVITTLPGTYSGNQGLLSNAANLAVDGSGSLYIADSGNDVIRYVDSSGNIRNIATGLHAPVGVAVDNFGEVYFDEPASNAMYEIYDYGSTVQMSGTGTGPCTASKPCSLKAEALSDPGTINIDSANHLFFSDSHKGAAMSTVQPLPANLAFLSDPFPYQSKPSSPIAVDASDNIYSLWSLSGEVCEIVRSTLQDAEDSNVNFTEIAGGRTCGFGGDGGQAGDAEIGKSVGQMAFDIAGNLYFTDTVNQRVRRVDAMTGIIRTIAGNGTAGYSGDGGSATSAELSSPTGLAVDSQGQVFAISAATSTGTAQIVRKIGPNGFLSFGKQPKGSNSAPQPVTVSNIGNSGLTLTKAVITGADSRDFSIDPNTTSCNLSAGASLSPGQSCEIGVIFNPSGEDNRTASLVLLDNSIDNSDTVQLTGIGALPEPKITITSPAAGTSVGDGATVRFRVAVISTSPAAPNGRVRFSLDGRLLGFASIRSGAAVLYATKSTPGTHQLSVMYDGDAHHSMAGPVTRVYRVSHEAGKLKPAHSISSSDRPQTYFR